VSISTKSTNETSPSTQWLQKKEIKAQPRKKQLKKAVLKRKKQAK
jgi:hypothetical protein